MGKEEEGDFVVCHFERGGGEADLCWVMGENEEEQEPIRVIIRKFSKTKQKLYV